MPLFARSCQQVVNNRAGCVALQASGAQQPDFRKKKFASFDYPTCGALPSRSEKIIARTMRRPCEKKSLRREISKLRMAKVKKSSLLKLFTKQMAPE
jgi:hypothetical protein